MRCSASPEVSFCTSGLQPEGPVPGASLPDDDSFLYKAGQKPLDLRHAGSGKGGELAGPGGGVLCQIVDNEGFPDSGGCFRSLCCSRRGFLRLPGRLERQSQDSPFRREFLGDGRDRQPLFLPHTENIWQAASSALPHVDEVEHAAEGGVPGIGNSAAADALLLSRIAEKVILVHRRDQLRATKVYHAPLMQAENVEFRWNSTVTELLHEGKLTGVRLKDVHTGAESVLPCDGLFISVGRKPATELVRGQLELDAGGYVAAGETTETSLPGVYAAGDVRTKPLRQVVTAVADGAMAVYMAEEYLAGGVPAARSPAGT